MKLDEMRDKWEMKRDKKIEDETREEDTRGDKLSR